MVPSICFVNDFFLKDDGVVTTGPMVQMYLIGKELARRGWRVSHVVTTKNDKAGQVERHSGMDVYYIPYQRYGVLIGARMFLKKLHEANADVYYQRGRSPMTGLAAYFAKHNGRKFLWSAAGEGGMARKKYTKEQIKKKSTIKKFLIYPYFLLQDRIYEYGIQNADIVFAQTEYQLQALHEEFCRSGIIFRSGFPIPNIKTLEKPVPPIIMWIGAIKFSKRPELFLELAKCLRNEKAYFIMAGHLNDEHYKKLISRQSEEQEKFNYIGEIPFDKVSEWFFKASLIINTTIDGYEGLPNVFIQSWLHGVPVVSLHSDPDNIIKKYQMGYQTGDFKLMAERVRHFIRNISLRREMGQNARNFSVQEFGLEKIVDKFINVLR